MGDAVTRVGPYERLYRVDTYEGSDPAIIDVLAFIGTLGHQFTPTCYILGSDSDDSTQGWAWLDHVPMGQPDTEYTRSPMACYVVHPGAIRRIRRSRTSAQQIYIGGFNP